MMPKIRKKGAPQIQPAPAPRMVAPSPVFTPGGAAKQQPGGTPFRFPNGTPLFSPAAGPAPAVVGKDPSSDLSWQDSGFNTTIANLLAQKNQGKAALTSAGRRAVEDRDRNVSLLSEGRGKARTATTQSANKSGLFYSGKLGKDLGDVDTDYGRRTEDVTTQFTRGEQDRAVQDQGLDAAFNQAQQTAAQQAIDRWINGAVASEQATTPSLQALIDALTGLNAGRR